MAVTAKIMLIALLSMMCFVEEMRISEDMVEDSAEDSDDRIATEEDDRVEKLSPAGLAEQSQQTQRWSAWAKPTHRRRSRPTRPPNRRRRYGPGPSWHRRGVSSWRGRAWSLLEDVAPAPTCSMNTAFEKCRSKWAGRCTTLDECQETCRKTKGCTAFNWWPGKGGCRHILADVSKCTEKKTDWTTVGGSPACEATVEAQKVPQLSERFCRRDGDDEDGDDEEEDEEDPTGDPNTQDPTGGDEESEDGSSLSEMGTDDEGQMQSQRLWRRRRHHRRRSWRTKWYNWPYLQR